ncbi:MAG: hypothetical protein PHN88_15075 [Ignavibacteria bacterium]|nr:hypothetical protein [Ignavibacteria bacterium]
MKKPENFLSSGFIFALPTGFPPRRMFSLNKSLNQMKKPENFLSSGFIFALPTGFPPRRMFSLKF